MATNYTHEYLISVQQRYKNHYFNSLKKGLEQANDTEYAKSAYLFPFLFAYGLRDSSTYHQEIMDIYEHDYKLGNPFDITIETIKERIAKKEKEIISEKERAKPVHFKRECYKLLGLFSMKHLPIRVTRYNSEWELISERLYTYNLNYSLFWELFKRGKSEQEKVDLFRAIYGTKCKEIIHIEDKPIIIWEDNEPSNLSPRYLAKYIIKNYAFAEVMIMLADYSKDFLDEETTSVLHTMMKNDGQDLVPDTLYMDWEKEVPKIEWLGTTKQLYDLFLALYQKRWIEALDFDLIEKYFTQTENIRKVNLTKPITFKDIRTNPKVNVASQVDKISWLGLQRNLGELFIELYQKKWISNLPPKLIKAYFSKSNTIADILRPYNVDGKATYSQVYSEEYKCHFGKILKNI